MSPEAVQPRYKGFPGQLQNPTFTDITLVVGTSRTRIPAHRVIICEHSTFFRQNCSDLTVAELAIPTWEPQIIHFVVRYLYLGKLECLDFDTMMTIFECAEDLGIDCLMEWALYTAVLEGGKYEEIFQDRAKLEKLLKKMSSAIAEERESYVYRTIFKLLLAWIYESDLMKEDWFVVLLKENSEIGIELLKALADGSGIPCFTRECKELVGFWKKCRICSDEGWTGDMDDW